jgi:hypothetical protein
MKNYVKYLLKIFV